MHMIGEGGMDGTTRGVFAFQLVHKRQDNACALVRIGVDIVFERGALRLVEQQFQLVAMVVDKQHILLHVVAQHHVALTCGIVKEVLLTVHVMMIVHHTFQFGNERRHDIAKQFVLALDLAIDIAHTNAHPRCNIAPRGLGIALFQEYPSGHHYNLLACIVFLNLHHICFY